jgi:hypothetical protein
MTDQGLRLETLELRHPEPARLAPVLEAIGAGHLAITLPADRPGLRAVLRGADGEYLVLNDTDG